MKKALDNKILFEVGYIYIPEENWVGTPIWRAEVLSRTKHVINFKIAPGITVKKKCYFCEITDVLLVEHVHFFDQYLNGTLSADRMSNNER